MFARRPDEYNNFIYLFLALIIYLLVLPIGTSFEVIPDKISNLVAITCLFGMGIWSIRDSKKQFRIAIVMVAIAMAGFAIDAAYDIAAARHVASLALVAFLLTSILTALRQVIYGVEMNANRLYGAVCVYLMIGILWAVLYDFLYYVKPEAFAGVSGGDETQMVWVYYSFVTLTTLGYGDILPISVSARTLAYSEAILGVFYMAMLVAALVSGYLAVKQTEKSPPGG